MSGSALPIAVAVGLFVGMVAALELGYRIGRRQLRVHAGPHKGIGVIEAAIFALLGLLLGFAFSGAMSRLDGRRQLIVQEANAIGTAYLRLDLLPSADQPPMRQLFRRYVEARLAVYDSLPDLAAAERQMQRAAQLQQEIWTRAIAATRPDHTQNTARVVLPALNEMIDITTARTVALRTHLPPSILVLLISVALLSALVAGYAMSERTRRSLLHGLLYAAAVSITLYTILDLDNPRVGLIRLDAAEKTLRQLHDSIR